VIGKSDRKEGQERGTGKRDRKEGQERGTGKRETVPKHVRTTSSVKSTIFTYKREMFSITPSS
jgi:hypothetical protein